jgi:steroid delta-isomerase-like uncharacterized protein
MSAQSVIDAAKAPITAYNSKDWKAAKASLATAYVYDEVATQRKVEGHDNVLAVWQGWATAFPDSKGEIHSAIAGGNTVTIELTWRGTHKGPLQMPSGPIAPTGKRIDIRACQVTEVADGKAKATRQYFDMATMLRQLGLGS